MAGKSPSSSGPPISGKGPAGKGKPSGKVGAWIKAHPGQAAAGGGVVLVLGIAAYRAKAGSSASGAAAAGTTGTAGGTTGYTDSGTATPYTYGGSSGGDTSGADYANLETQIASLNGNLSKLTFSKNGYLKTVAENGKKNPVTTVHKPKPKAPRPKHPMHGRPIPRRRPPKRR